jgi:hypothetical protein
MTGQLYWDATLPIWELWEGVRRVLVDVVDTVRYMCILRIAVLWIVSYYVSIGND